MILCANCNRDMTFESHFEYSWLYNPHSPDIILCETCFSEENELTSKTGTNNHPERLEKYRNNIALSKLQKCHHL